MIVFLIGAAIGAGALTLLCPSSLSPWQRVAFAMLAASGTTLSLAIFFFLKNQKRSNRFGRRNR